MKSNAESLKQSRRLGPSSYVLTEKNVVKTEHHLNGEDIDETSNVVYEEVFWNV